MAACWPRRTNDRPALAIRLPSFLAQVPLVLVLCLSGTARSEEPTLANVVRTALERNERPQIAAQEVVSAEAAVARARAAFLPDIALDGTGSLRLYSPSGASGALAVSQPLLVVGAFPLYSSAKHGLAATRFGAVDQRRQVSFDAARSFFAVVAQQRVLSAAQTRLDRSEASLKDARARAAAQLVSSNDVSRLEVDRASSLQAVASAQAALAVARIGLEYLLDARVPGELQPPAEALAPADLDVEALVRDAAARRPDVASAHEVSAAAWASAAEPALRFVPTLGAVGLVAAADRPYAPDHNVDAALTLNLSWSIWDAGLRGADASARRAAARSADLEARALSRRVEADVRGAVATLIAARDALKAAEEGLEAARKSAKETTALYDQGLAKAIELVDANLSRFEAEVGLASAQLTLRQAEMDLRAAVGLFAIEGVQ